MMIVFATASAVYMVHSFLILLNSGVECHCAFDIVCTLEKLAMLPTMGKMPTDVVHLRLVAFETGMMDNIPGAMFFYAPAMITAVWALAHREHWLAMRLAIVLTSMVVAVVICHCIVYFAIRDHVGDSTIEFLFQGLSPLVIVGVVSLSVAVALWRRSASAPLRNDDWLVSSRKIWCARALSAVVTLCELAAVLVLLVSPSALSESFKSLTGHSPDHLKSMGYSTPRCIAVVVLGSVVAHVLALVPRSTHRHAKVLLALSAVFHVSQSVALTATIAHERRHSTATEAAFNVAYCMLAILFTLTVCVIVTVALVWSMPRSTANRRADTELREFDAVDVTHNDDDSSTNSSSSSLFEPVPSRLRLQDPSAATAFVGIDSGNQELEPIPARSKIEITNRKI
jgi:hypothetical protein